MIINTIKFKNIKCFKEETVFSPRKDFNVLIGPNGSGKSSLMDILHMTLRHFFLFSYQLSSEEDPRSHLERVDNGFNDTIKVVLAKYSGNRDQTVIDISLEVTQSDIDNIRQIAACRESLIKEAETYSSCEHIIIDFLSEKQEELKVGQVFDYKIVEYKLVPNPKDNADFFLKYLHVIEGIELLAEKLDIDLSPTLIYVSPYRVVDKGALKVDLSQSEFGVERGRISRMTSHSSSSLIKMAALYFSEKHRGYEASPEGYHTLWEKDPDVVLLSEALQRLGYSWDIRLISRNRNSYEILLKKKDREFVLSDASSGEIELFDLLFGLITLNLRGGVIIIDEPELHLHPQWVTLLRDYLLKLSADKQNQVMVITHSPSFINSNSFPFISRIYKDDNDSSLIYQVKEEDQGAARDLLHFINATNNEKVFFSDFVIMVEGDTDEIVFNSILEDIKNEKKYEKQITVMQVRGKTNYDKFNSFLSTLQIPSAFIGDIDNISQLAGDHLEIKAMLIANAERINRLVIKNPGARDNEGLLRELENAIKKKDTEKLQSFYDYIVSFRSKLRPDLTKEQKRQIASFIEAQHNDNVFILPNGEIEAYFPKGFKGKDLDKVLDLLHGESYENWKKEDGYKNLKSILLTILQRNRILS